MCSYDSVRILIVRNASEIVEKIRPQILCSKAVFLNLAVYDIMWKNMVHPKRLQIII